MLVATASKMLGGLTIIGLLASTVLAVTARAKSKVPLPLPNPKRLEIHIVLPQPNPRRTYHGAAQTNVAEMMRPANTGAEAGKKNAAETASAGGTKNIVARLSEAIFDPAELAYEAAIKTNFEKSATTPAKKIRIGSAQAYKAIGPLLKFSLSARDLANVKEAVRLTFRGEHQSAVALRAKIKDPDAAKLVYWYNMRKAGSPVSPLAIKKFIDKNTDWPSQKLLQKRAEALLFTKNSKADTVEKFFANSQPVTGAGKAALARALLARGKKDRAIKLVKSAWRDHRLSSQMEKQIHDQFGKYLSNLDHRRRLDRFLTTKRKRAISAAKRTAKRIGKTADLPVKARIALLRRSRNAATLYNKLPKSERKTPGVMLNRIQWLRRKDRDLEAWELLQKSKSLMESRLIADLWWSERRINSRSALNQGRPGVAYAIASGHGPLSDDNLADAAFLSGWIALQYMTDPVKAKQHFTRLREVAKRGRHIARAEYWLGRTAEEAGDSALAATHYTNAAKHDYNYYGQLAAERLAPNVATLKPRELPLPTKKDIETFLKRDSVKALLISRQAQLKGLQPLFLRHLAWSLESAGELTLLAELATQIDTVHSAVRVAKIAVYRGFPLDIYAYPLDVLPDYKKLNKDIENGLLHALARQESEFNAKAKSWVGARGLMQLMPGTARMIARQYNVKYRRHKLTGDPSYNMMLGAAHLRDLIDQYKGAYALTLVAYNAGPGRVRQWIRAFGDPRSDSVDAINWVERIPFKETRQYVKRILASLQIYRARLGEDRPLRLTADIKLGRPALAGTTKLTSNTGNPTSGEAQTLP